MAFDKELLQKVQGLSPDMLYRLALAIHAELVSDVSKLDTYDTDEARLVLWIIKAIADQSNRLQEFAVGLVELGELERKP